MPHLGLLISNANISPEQWKPSALGKQRPQQANWSTYAKQGKTEQLLLASHRQPVWPIKHNTCTPVNTGGSGWRCIYSAGRTCQYRLLLSVSEVICDTSQMKAQGPQLNSRVALRLLGGVQTIVRGAESISDFASVSV